MTADGEHKGIIDRIRSKKEAEILIGADCLTVVRSQSLDGSGIAANVRLKAGVIYNYVVTGLCDEDALLSVKSRFDDLTLRGPSLYWKKATTVMSFAIPTDGLYELRILFPGKASVDSRFTVYEIDLNEGSAVSRASEGSAPLFSGTLTAAVAYRVLCSPGTMGDAQDGSLSITREGREPILVDLSDGETVNVGFVADTGRVSVDVTGQDPHDPSFRLDLVPTADAFDPLEPRTADDGLLEVTLLSSADPLRIAKVVSQLSGQVSRINVGCTTAAIVGVATAKSRPRNIRIAPAAEPALHDAIAGLDDDRTVLVCSDELDYPADFAAVVQGAIGSWRDRVCIALSGWPDWHAQDKDHVAPDNECGQMILSRLSRGAVALPARVRREIALADFSDDDAETAISEALCVADIPIVTPARPRKWVRRV